VIKQAAFLCGCLLLAACSALLNSGRPKYEGAIVRPLWHDGGFDVTETPIVRGGVVYAVGQSLGSGPSHIYAFDARTGRRRWIGRTAATRIIAVGDRTLLIGGAAGSASALDTASGLPATWITPRPVDDATYTDGTWYVTGPAHSLSALRGNGEQIWTRSLPVRAVTAPVVGGNLVYAFGVRHVDELTPELSGVYAFDRRSGALRWKRDVRERFGKYRFDAKSQKMAWTEKPDKVTVGIVLADARAAYVWEQHRDETIFINRSVLIAIDARSGTTRWQRWNSGICLDLPNLADPASVVVCESPREAGAHGLVYRALARASGAIQWQGTTMWDYDRFVPYGADAIVSDRRVHDLLNENMQTSPDSWLTLVDRRTGSEVWRTEVVPLATFTLAAAGSGVVVVGSKPFTWADPHVAGDPSVAGLWAWPLRLR
jgi:outer membrane protein assembly factor BamB